MRNDRFEWDDEKAKSNLAKHDISFEAGCLVFDDPNIAEQPDDDPDEERFKATGMLDGRLLTVIYTERLPRLRIISVRKATSHEQKEYFAQD
jgi:uncharacterized protein